MEIIDHNTKCDIAEDVKFYISTKPKMLQEYYNGQLFTNMINHVLDSTDNNSAIVNLTELCFSAITMFSTAMEAVSKYTSKDVALQIQNDIKNVVESFNEES